MGVDLMLDEEIIQESQNQSVPLQGRLLIASRSLDGSCFERSVIYICAHDQKGAIGIMINKDVGCFTIRDILDEADMPHYVPQSKLNKKLHVLFGGPVDAERVIILSLSKDQEKAFHELRSVTLHTNPERFLRDYIDGEHNRKFVITKGISTWDANQLEQEVAENSWLVMDVEDPKIIFSPQNKNKWDRIIKNIGINFDNLVGYSGNC